MHGRKYSFYHFSSDCFRTHGEHLQTLGYSLVVIDDLRDGKKEAVPDGATFYAANFSDETILDTIFTTHNITTVIHLAASANVPDSVVHPLPYYQNNVTGTIALLKKMKQYSVKSILFSSTAAVYGIPVNNTIIETDILKPVNPYGWSKLFDEQIIADTAAAHGLEYIIFRYFCAAGATANNGESRGYESHLIPLVIDTALGKRDEIKVFGNQFPTPDGTGVRDYIHVSDIARAHELALAKLGTVTNQIFNLGTNAGYSVLEIIEETEKVLGQKVNFSIVKERPGDPPSLIALAHKAKEQLGWEPSYNLQDIITSVYAWRNNPRY
ncbi:MAG: UDP-glucose 4-epimerase GalE [Sediminibacterium sp.]|nr:UDP-glucose 4-epimerase GalE [Sediminibacterium sp.]